MKFYYFKLISSFFIITLVFQFAFASSVNADNLLKNEFFESWVDNNQQPEHWTGDDSFGTNWFQNGEDVYSGNYSVRVNGGGTRILRQKGLEEVVGDQTYYAGIWVMGTGEVELGITYPSGTTSFGEVVELDNADWTRITLERTPPAHENNEGGIAIRTDDLGGDTPSDTLYIGAAWLSTHKVPSGLDLANVDILVQPSANVSLTADTTYYDFGVLDVGSSSNSATAVTLENDGQVGVDLSATVNGTGDWSIVDSETPGHDQFALLMGTYTTELTDRADYHSLHEEIENLYDNLEVDGTVDSWYWIDMPETVSKSDKQTFTVQVTATSR